MKVTITNTYHAKDVKFSEIIDLAQGKVDVRLEFATDNPFEPVSMAFQMDQEKCEEIGNKLLIIAEKLKKQFPEGKFQFGGGIDEDPKEPWKE